MSAFDDAGGEHLDALEGRIDIARSAGRAAFLAQDVPRFEREAQFDVDAGGIEVAEQREAEVQVRREPARRHRIAVLAELGQHAAEILLDEMRQHEAVVQLGAPALQSCRPVRGTPEARHQRTHQELLGEAHARMRRHLEGTQFEQAQPAGRAVGRIEFVDAELGPVGIAGHIGQQVAQHPVDQPRRARTAGLAQDALQFGEGDLDLVDRIVARFVQARRLARRPDEEA